MIAGLRVAVVGGGWAGLAAAVKATLLGHHVTVYEASRIAGGRARAVNGVLPDGAAVALDNGQHILIGAYRDTLALLAVVGCNAEQDLKRLPLTLQDPAGNGIALPDWPSPLDALAGIWRARGWRYSDKLSLTRAALRWQWMGFRCGPGVSVADLCKGMSPAVLNGFIEPLCVSALNTPADRASGQVFLTVLHDSMFGGRGSSNLLLPQTDLTSLFPATAIAWLRNRGAKVHIGRRVSMLSSRATVQGTTANAGGVDKLEALDVPAENIRVIDGEWRVDGEPYDRVIIATSPSQAMALLTSVVDGAAAQTSQAAIKQWLDSAAGLQFEAIATVYTYAPGARLPLPMMALPSDDQHPAQFVFDRGQLGGPDGLWAFVISASNGSKEALQTAVLRQAQVQLSASCLAHWPSRRGEKSAAPAAFGLSTGPGESGLNVVQTIVEKRATFACTPGLQRPSSNLGNGLMVCGDYLEGPYPATLEGAVRSGLQAALQL